MDEQPATTPPTAPRRRVAVARVLGLAGLGLVALLAIAQLVPYGHSYVPFGHPEGNPPVSRAAVWDDPRAEAIATKACYDCHSSLTSWWLGTNVAPLSWLAQHDVDEGRAALDFSAWDRRQPDLDELVEAVDEGEMPPLQYRLAHGEARLDAEERRQLAAGLRRLYATDPPAATGGEADDD